MLHPKLKGLTTAGDNTKEAVALYLVHGRMMMDDQGWLWGPGIIHAPIPEAETQPIIDPWMAILHTNAAPRYTKAEALIAYWRRSDITGEAHFQNDLLLTQAMPVTRRADCNYKANSFYESGILRGAISYESADNGYATLESTPWNLDQLENFIASLFLIKICYPNVWCTEPTGPYSRGIGYHSQYKEWSSFTGKTCPGGPRIRQMDYIRHEVQERVAAFYAQCGGSC